MHIFLKTYIHQIYISMWVLTMAGTKNKLFKFYVLKFMSWHVYIDKH